MIIPNEITGSEEEGRRGKGEEAAGRACKVRKGGAGKESSRGG